MHVPIAKPRGAQVGGVADAGAGVWLPVPRLLPAPLQPPQVQRRARGLGPAPARARACCATCCAPRCSRGSGRGEMVGKVWRAAKTRPQRLELVLDFVRGGRRAAGAASSGSRAGAGLCGACCWWGSCSILWLNLAAHFETDAAAATRWASPPPRWLYNFFFFNAGYHQAHHFWPQVPWQQLPEATRELAASARVRPTLQTSLSPINPLWVADSEALFCRAVRSADGVDDYLRDPLGRYLSGTASCIGTPRRTCAGSSCGGAPDETSSGGWSQVLDVERTPAGAARLAGGRAAAGVCRTPRAFTLFVKYMQQREKDFAAGGEAPGAGAPRGHHRRGGGRLLQPAAAPRTPAGLHGRGEALSVAGHAPEARAARAGGGAQRLVAEATRQSPLLQRAAPRAASPADGREPGGHRRGRWACPSARSSGG